MSGDRVAGVKAAVKIADLSAPRRRLARRSGRFEPCAVLVTGGADFVGRHVARELAARGHEVRILDSLRPDVHGEAAKPPAYAELRAGNVRDPDAAAAALKEIDAVIHLAAKVGLGVDAQDLTDYASSNDAGTATLLAGMARADVGKLTLASSMAVYGEGFGRSRAV